jgi:hypothetical protein
MTVNAPDREARGKACRISMSQRAPGALASHWSGKQGGAHGLGERHVGRVIGVRLWSGGLSAAIEGEDRL